MEMDVPIGASLLSWEAFPVLEMAARESYLQPLTAAFGKGSLVQKVGLLYFRAKDGVTQPELI